MKRSEEMLKHEGCDHEGKREEGEKEEEEEGQKKEGGETATHPNVGCDSPKVEAHPPQIEEESSPSSNSFDVSSDTERTSTPTEVTDEQSDSSSVNLQSQSTLEQSGDISVNQKQTPAQPEHPLVAEEQSQFTTGPPVHPSDNSQEQLEKTAADQEQSESCVQTNQKISNTTFAQEHLDCSPTDRQPEDSTLVNQEQSESVPVDQEKLEGVLVNQEQSESVPVDQEQSESVPDNQEQSESVLLNHEQSKINQEQSEIGREHCESVPANQDNQEQSESTITAPTDQEQLESNEQQDSIPASGKNASVSLPPAEQNTDHFLSFPKAVQSAVASDMPTLLILSNGTSKSEQESLVLQALAGSGDLCLVDGLQIFSEEKEVGPEIPVAEGEELVESSAQGVDFGLEDEGEGVCV